MSGRHNAGRQVPLKPALRLNLTAGQIFPQPASPASAREKKTEFNFPKSQNKESAKQINHHKSFSDLNKGLDFIFQPKSRPPSRASNYGDAVKEKDERRKESCPEKGSPKSPMTKSLSRSYIYDGEPGIHDDDLDVYHTITGGKLRSITATRSTDPYSKITRRPLHKLLSGQKGLRGKTDSLASLADMETDSVLSLAGESWGRVR